MPYRRYGLLCLLMCMMTVGAVSAQSTGNQASGKPVLSDDGRYVAFVSDASNLVEGDTNDTTDIFVYDRETAQVSRVSVDSDGNQALEGSHYADISADGRYVVFESSADLANLGRAGTTNIYHHDRETGETIFVSKPADGVLTGLSSLNPSVSDDGQRVAFWSNAALLPEDTNGVRDVYVYDVATDEMRLVSVSSEGEAGNADSRDARIAGDGQSVVFSSSASNLVADDHNETDDIFVHSLITGETVRVNVSSEGEEADAYTFPNVAISRDGTRIVFQSQAASLWPLVSDSRNEIYLHNLTTHETRLVSATSDGEIGECSAFCLGSSFPDISADGAYVVFQSDVDGLSAEDTNDRSDIYLHEISTGETRVITLTADGGAFAGASRYPSISGDGGVVAFETTNAILAGDVNFTTDVYVLTLATGDLVYASRSYR